MTIGKLSSRTGLAPSAIRYYEELGLIAAVGRSGGRRVFDEKVVARLAVIQLAKEAGFTLDEIRRLLTEFGAYRWKRLAEAKIAEIERARARLQTMTSVLKRLMKCDCLDLELCGREIQRHRDRRGPRGDG